MSESWSGDKLLDMADALLHLGLHGAVVYVYIYL